MSRSRRCRYVIGYRVTHSPGGPEEGHAIRCNQHLSFWRSLWADRCKDHR